MSSLIRLAGLVLAFAWLVPATVVPAQTPTTGPAQLSIGTKFVKDFCLEGKSDGTLVINKCNAQPPQAIDYDDTTGQIKTAGKCVAAQTKGQALVLAECAEANEQFWTFEANGTLKSDSGLCADVLNFHKDPGTSVIAWDCTGTENQAFFLTNIRIAKAEKSGPSPADISTEITGTPSIASYFVQGLCLEAKGAKGEISIEVCDRSAGQDFRFKSGNSGAIIQGDRCLTTTGQGNTLALASCNGAAEQDWTFTLEGMLRTRNNLCGDILRFERRPGTPVIAWECTATDNQKWYPAVAAKSGSFTLGAAIGEQLKAGDVTTLTLTPGFSPGNLTGAGGKTLSADANGKITGGEKDTIVVGGAGVLTQRFAKGLVAPGVKDASGTSLLPGDWSFFSGASAGTMKLD